MPQRTVATGPIRIRPVLSANACPIRAVDCARGGVTGAKNLSRAPAICNSDLGSDSAS
jgi:hypothetical protein